MAVKIAIVDDKSLNRRVLSDKLARHADFEVCLSASDGKDFMEKLSACIPANLPHVVLMDLEMPVMDGVDTIAVASCVYPDIRFVVLTIFDDEEKIFRAIKAGAFGYLLKDDSTEDIVDTLRQMKENGIGPISPGIAHKILQMVQRNELKMPVASLKEKENFFDLSQRETAILQLLAQGLSYKEIAVKLIISVNTAKKHVINVYDKLHVNSRAQAVNIAYQRGMLK